MKIYMKMGSCYSWACFFLVALIVEQTTMRALASSDDSVGISIPVVSNPGINLLQNICSRYNASKNLFITDLDATILDLGKQLLLYEKRFATAEWSSSHEEKVFTMVQCRNYLSTEDCYTCFDAAKLEILNCPSLSNGAWVIYDGCFLRYENKLFYNQTTLPGSGSNCGNLIAQNSSIFDEDVDIFVQELQSSIPKIGSKFATIERELGGGGGNIYWVAQCIDTINQTGCLDCLRIAYGNIQKCFNYTEGRAFDVACYLRYSNSNFFANNQTTALSYHGGEDADVISGRSRNMQLTGVVVSGIVGISVLICVFWYTIFKHEDVVMHSFKGNDPKIVSFMKRFETSGPKQYSYSEIVKMTNSFKDKLGVGGYGFVYKGKLPDGRLVAVKVSKGKTLDGEDFINEVASISRTSHVNVVTLLGFCFQMNTKALVFQFMPNGSLDKFLKNKVGSSHDSDNRLGWKTLFEIAVGTARGLEYLHRGCNARIVHFDIKPHNILLDEDFCPKISDFGLAKLSETKQSIFSSFGTRGTVGYIDPEVFCRNFGKVSHKSDVYSYGMMMLEIVGVRTYNGGPIERSSQKYFPNWIYEHLQLGKDLDIQVLESEEEEGIARKLILVGLWCIQTNPLDRPSMSKVVDMLEDSLHSLQIPPKPFFYSAPQTQNENSPDRLESLPHHRLQNEAKKK